MEMGDKTLEELISPKEVPIILYSFLIAQSVNLFTNIVSKNIGDLIGLGLNIFLLLLIILGFITHSRFKKKRREQLKSLDMDSLISSKELEFKRKYRGLIAFISDPPPPRIKDEDAKADWVKECKDEIDRSIKSQDITEVSKISGIGQTFKAINHHIGKLTHCWLIFSPQSGVNVDIINYFFEKITNKSITPNFVKIDDPNDSKHIKEKIDSIYKNLPGDFKATDIIADITAGNKPMTTGMILSCLHSERNIEYIEQSERRALIEVDIRPKLTGVELEGK
jgi:hypothetical protein